MDLRKIDHPFTISEGRNIPLSFFIVPAGVVKDMFELIRTHENVHDGRKLFDLLFLISDSIKQLLLFILVLILKILQLNQVHSILFLDFLKAFTHFVYLLVKVFVVFLNVEQLLLPAFLLFSKLLLFFLLLL